MNIAQALTIRGWMSEPELKLLAEFASNHRYIVEVGSYCGRSTRVLADNTEGTVIAVDPWDGMCQTYGITIHSNGYIKEYNEFQINLADHITNSKVIIQRSTFNNSYIPNPDMIFIDAIHEYVQLKNDIIHAGNMMKCGGLLCGHDYCLAWPGVILAVDEMFPNRQIKETIWYVEL